MIKSDRLLIRAIFITAIMFLAGPVISCRHMSVTQPLEIELPAADLTQPRVAAMTKIRWTVTATGGVGSYTYEFYILKGNEDRVVQSGPLQYWDWSPDGPGRYRVKVIVTDFRDNKADSGWSHEYEIVPELLAGATTSDKPSPQAANMANIRWTSKATGGVGANTFEFHLRKGNEDRVVQSGTSSSWNWKPNQAGLYRVKAIVKDTLGNTADSGWSSEYEIVPELLADITTAGKPSPQAANMADIRWTSKATGGVGAHTFEFHILKGNEDRVAQSGTSSSWNWKPNQAGLYRVKTVVKDTLGNTADSGWSSEYEIVPELLAEIPAADKPSPQAANMANIKWSAMATGGVGAHAFEFHILKDKEDRLVQSGTSSYWSWKPNQAGLYRVKAIVKDTLGNTADSGWSSEYEIMPELLADIASAGKPSPQAANMAIIKWTAKATGGVGTHTFEFHILKGNDDKLVQSGPLPYWDWKPNQAGLYKVKAVVKDTLGNTADSGWSSEYEIVPELLAETATADKPAPQAANMANIKWSTKATGGVGGHTFEFHILKGNDDKLVQSGPLPYWDWKPDQAGLYKIKAVVKDTLGNTADSGWSSEYEIAPELLAGTATADKPSPQAANMARIKWSVKATGGVYALIYEFHILKDKEDRVVQSDTLPYWDWLPDRPGKYRIKAVVRDMIGNTADSGWSSEYEIVPELITETVSTDKPTLQAANMADIRWTAKATGGVGPHIFEFHILKDNDDRLVQSGPFPYWDWKPDQAGLYRIKAVAKDTLGNAADSGWSAEVKIEPELLAEATTADKPSPQAANMVNIRWTAKATGGVGAHTFEFHILKGKEDKVVQSGPFPYWDWKPDAKGLFRVKAVVKDTLGNTADSEWSSEYKIAPELFADIATADKPSPQAANMTSIKWTAKASGGVGAHTFEFHILKGKDDKVVQSGLLPYWDWKPNQAGLYKIKAVVKDTVGNAADSGWSSEYEIMPELLADITTADKPSPQAANMANIRWTAKATGGVGTHTFEFHVLKDREDRVVQSGPSQYWDWKPRQAGLYSVKAVVKDALGNMADSGWSPEFEVRRIIKSSLVALLPIENLSGVKAPVKKISQLINTELKRAGFNIIDNNILEEFMLKHRIRYTGAIDLRTAEAFQKEIGVEAVLITSIELYSDTYPPKISLISRLTSTGTRPEIMWMDSVGISGDDSPGILGLGLIEDPEELLMNAVRSLSDKLSLNLWGEEKTRRPPRGAKKDRAALIVSAPDSGKDSVDDKGPAEDRPQASAFVPKIFYRSPLLSPDMKYRVAIMPFLNKSDRKNAGDIMPLHFMEQLREIMNFDVIEPGIVRNHLLGFRIIMNEGMSFENAGFIFSTLETDADLILSGTVLDYQDNISIQGTPKVDFSVIVIEKKSREVVWSSKSYRTGNEGVIFFDKGQINVAHSLASGMVRGVVEMLLME